MTNDTQISDRELEILRLVATGATNQQIAQQLNISINTVKVHLRNIFGKIGAVSRTEATVYAIRNGLVPGIGNLAEPLPLEPEAPALGLALTTPEPLIASPPLADAPVVAAAAPPVAPPAPTPAGRQLDRRLLWLGGGLLALVGVALLAWRTLGAPQPPAPTAPAATALSEAVDAERWVVHDPLPRPRDGYALAAYEPEGRLFVIGGSADGAPRAWLDRFDPQSGRWVSLDDKPTAVSNAGAVSLRGKIYVPGGEDADGRPTAALEAYDPQERRWESDETLAPLPEARSRYALTVWEGRIFLFGGWDGAGPSADVFVYDPALNEWSRGVALPTPRQYGAATVVAGKVYMVGGEGEGGALSDALRLDPADEGGGQWEPLAPLPVPVARPGAITVINSLLVFDGAGKAGWQYDATADDWPSYPIPTDAPVAAVATLLGPSIFFLGDSAAATPGALGEYRVIFTTFVPARGGPPTNP